MSKMIIGKYDDGSVKRSYFRKTKHHRIKRNGFFPIRWKMYIAKGLLIEQSFKKDQL